MNGPTAYSGYNYHAPYGWNSPVQQASYYPGYYPAPNYGAGYAPVMPVGYAPANVPSYWYGQ